MVLVKSSPWNSTTFLRVVPFAFIFLNFRYIGPDLIGDFSVSAPRLWNWMKPNAIPNDSISKRMQQIQVSSWANFWVGISTCTKCIISFFVEILCGLMFSSLLGISIWSRPSSVEERLSCAQKVLPSPRVGCCDAYHNVWISHLNGFTDSDSVDPIWHQLHGGSSMPSPDSTKQIVLDSMRLSPTFSCDRSLLTFYFTLEEWFEIFYV